MLPLASLPFRFPVQGQLELGQVLELRVPFSLTVEWLPLLLFQSISVKILL
jgi:hypothetical protein